MVTDKHLQENFPGIDSTPGVCGGDARIAGSRVPVWSLEEWRRLGQSDDDILESYPSLTAQDLLNAWAYVAANRDEIERCIRENQET